MATPAKILIVQSRPYQAFAGGDGAYTDALIQHLNDSGCEVVGITSASTKGRPRLWLQLAYSSLAPSAWHFRSTLRIGQRYLAMGPQMIRDAIAFLRDRKRVQKISPFSVAPDPAEQAWIRNMLHRLRPDLVILTFEAAGAVDVVQALSVPCLALVGFLPGRNFALSGLSAAEPTGPDGAAQFVNAIRRANRAAFSSRDDCNFARDTLGIAQPVYVGMGFSRREGQTHGHSQTVLFVGNRTEPNKQAVEWFCSRVWPAVRAAVPAAEFRIVGRVAHYFESDPAAGIVCVGEVATLDAEYHATRLVVAPLLTGSPGVKTKVAEAISFGCPLVATSLGVDGGDTSQLDPAGFVADEPDAFAEKVVALLTDEALWQEKQVGTAAVFRQLFSRGAAYGELDALIAAIAPAQATP